MSATPQLCEIVNAENLKVDMQLLDPCFFSAKDYKHTSSNDEVHEEQLSHLAHRIQRTPTDLIAHLQRLEIHHRHDNKNGLYGALLDLFIALGEKGKPLRMRMLKGLSNKLTTAQLAVFKRGMISSITATDVVPLTPYSRLSGAIIGSLQIAELVTESQQAQDLSLMDDVSDLLNSGQIAEAQTLLESALLDNPSQQAPSLELLMIYRHAKNIDAFKSTYQALAGRPLAAQSEWDEQANVFGIQASS